MDDYEKLVKELVKLPKETEWIEFKHNNDNPEEIGEYISALSNAATLHHKECAYMVWGIEDSTRKIVGTSFDNKAKKIGNEELENWLYKLLSDNANFSFHSVKIDNLDLILLIIYKAINRTIRFKNIDYIRVGAIRRN